MPTLCFFNSIRFWGGGEKLHLEYAEAFARRGYGVVVAADRKGILAAKAAEAGLEVAPQRIGNLSFLNPLKVLRLAAFFRKHRIDTVFFSTSQDFKAGGLAAWIAGVPRVVYLRGLAVPIKNTPVNRFLVRRVVTHFLANSQETARRMQQHFGAAFPSERLKVIYHGIDLAEFDRLPVKSLGLRKGNELLIGNAGRLTPQKGQMQLLEVAEILKREGLSFRLLIAGTGELEEELRGELGRRGLEQEVELLGFVEDMKSFMSEIDIFALSSLWEGFGYVLVEAMACRKPVAAFDLSSNPEIVARGESGLLAASVEEFAAHLARLIRDEGLRQRMGENGRLRVEAHFQLEDRISEVEQELI